MAVANQVGHYFLTRRKGQCGFRLHRGRLQLLRAPARMPASPSPICATGMSARAVPTAPSAIAARAYRAIHDAADAQVFPLVPPAVQELGNSNGFDIEMEDRGNIGHAGLIQAAQHAAGPGGARSRAPASVLSQQPGRHAATAYRHRPGQGQRAGRRHRRCQRHPVGAAWGGDFVNNFIDRARVKRVYMQGDAPFRMTPQDLDRWYVRTTTGTMAPFSSFATASWTVGPSTLTRYNGFPAIEIQGVPATRRQLPARRWRRWTSCSSNCPRRGL